MQPLRVGIIAIASAIIALAWLKKKKKKKKRKKYDWPLSNMQLLRVSSALWHRYPSCWCF